MSSTNDRSKDDPEKRDRSTIFSWIESIVHIDPVHVVSDIWDAFDMWRATRRWSPIQTMIPGLVLFFSCFVTICFGMLASNSKKLERYIKKADAVAPIQDGMTNEERKAATRKATSGTSDIVEGGLSEGGEESAQAKANKQAAAEEEAKNVAYADLLFRRVLQLEPNNKNALYFVASNLGIRGNLDQARGMMQSLAPADGKSYPRAHAWVAMDMLGQLFRNINVNRDELYHHLAIASDHPQTQAIVLSAYAQMLESDGKISEAINVMHRAAAKDGAFYLPLATMQAKYKQPIQSKENAERAVSHFSRSFGKKDEPDQDRISAAEAYIQNKNFEDAIKILQDGLGMRENRPLLRRALSNVYRYMYRSQITRTEQGQIKTNLKLLNDAMLSDPTNPAIGEEVAMLQNLGVTTNDDLIQALKRQLALGQTTAISHLLVGISYMNKGDLELAIKHWKFALGQDPNLVLAINNLAIAYSMLEPPQYDESLRLIDRAIELSRDGAEFLDSKGEILMRAGRNEEAIPFYEKALQIDPTRISSREKLVSCYEKLKMMDLADAQNNMIAKVREYFKSKGMDERGRSVLKMQPPRQENGDPSAITDSAGPVDFNKIDKELPSMKKSESSAPPE